MFQPIKSCPLRVKRSLQFESGFESQCQAMVASGTTASKAYLLHNMCQQACLNQHDSLTVRTPPSASAVCLSVYDHTYKLCLLQYVIRLVGSLKHCSPSLSLSLSVSLPYVCWCAPCPTQDSFTDCKSCFTDNILLATQKQFLMCSQGFELKRRGELKLIKVFQSEVTTYSYCVVPQYSLPALATLL